MAKQYGIDAAVMHPHSFRHLFGKTFLEKTQDITLLADLMGHESIDTTRIYTRKSATEQREIVDRVVTW
jgi:site-specific recombinase XerD